MRFIPELVVAVAQQSLGDALSSHADFSTSNGILNSYPSIISNITTGTKNKVTLLVPTNDAFTKFLQQANISEITQFPVSQLLTVFRYHTLDAPLTVLNFSAPRGITIPSKLRDELSNLRTPGPAKIDQYGDDAKGQVLFVSPSIMNPTKFRVRQGTSSDDHTASLRGGSCFHTLPQAAYSDFLVDGQEFTSMANVTVRVTVKDNQIWFNDAKVIGPNVLPIELIPRDRTNNGLIHILDRVMSANALPDSSTSSPAGTGTASPTSTATPPNAGNPISENICAAAVIALAAGVLLV
ncbi:fasciclin domain-containing protein [Colletotrichum salicis]|uniref:Fasciclin domain-containing protein n=1 Tax=Colletotrichum salicis TaxID=1209931 RepID=A0A135SYF7_9PEZI|nr:fasciclin domain-containing protein [Colletotrichum salicis]